MTEETKQVIDMVKEMFSTLNEKIDSSKVRVTIYWYGGICQWY